MSWTNPVVLLVIGAVLSQGASWYWWNKKIAAKAKELQETTNQRLFDRIVELEKQAASIQQTVLPLSTAFQAMLVKELTHMHTPEMDALLVKLGPPYLLTPIEEGRLADLLLQRVTDLSPEISEGERDAALIMPYVMKRVRAEALQLKAMHLVIVQRDLLDPTDGEQFLNP